MHHTRHILPTPRTCIWCRCGRCGVSWHRDIDGMAVVWVILGLECSFKGITVFLMWINW